MTNEISVASNDFDAIFGSFAGVFAILAIIIIPLLILSLALYIIQAIALMKIAENSGSDKGWMAWIPIANGFVMPMLVEDDVHEGMRGKFTLIYGLTLAASLILSGFIPLVALVPTVLTYYAFYIIVGWYSEKAVTHVVISVITLGLSMPFSLLRIRNREMRKAI